MIMAAVVVPEISVIVPAHNEAETVDLFTAAIAETLSGLVRDRWELVYVDDGSTDGTVPAVRAQMRSNPNIRLLELSRNFGKEAAMYAGLQESSGSYVTVMDADLQDPPEVLAQMYSMLTQGGYDIVCSRRVNRKGEGRLRSFLSNSFYGVINKLAGMELKPGMRDFALMRRCVADALLSMPERSRFYKGMITWVGFRRGWVEFENRERAAGETSWSMMQLARYAADGVISFSDKPLGWVAGAGAALAVAALAAFACVLLRAVLFGDRVAGWPSTMCVILGLGGMQLFAIGIVGVYLARALREVKARPVYLLRDDDDGQSGDSRR